VAQQVVKVTVSLQTDGTLLASEVDYIQPATQQSVEGNIVGLSTSGGNTILDLIAQNEISSAATDVLPLGNHVRITVPSTGVTYAINSNGFALPPGLTFTGISSLAVGQEVQAVVQGSVSTAANSGSSTNAAPVGPSAATFTTNSITLEPSQITGMVAGTNPGALSFTLATLPNFFVPPSATAGAIPAWMPIVITVQTTSATTFASDTNGILGLPVNDVVSVDGWVFSTPTGVTTTTVAADQVLLRPGPTPLF
jgi:hypothetical protein